jgi:cytochrome c-type biogenesis protein CcmH/NrfF
VSNLQFRIIKEYPGHTVVCLGVVSIQDIDQVVAEKIIHIAWHYFVNSGPNSDSQFIDWLVERYGFTAVKDPLSKT